VIDNSFPLSSRSGNGVLARVRSVLHLNDLPLVSRQRVPAQALRRVLTLDLDVRDSELVQLSCHVVIFLALARHDHAAASYVVSKLADNLRECLVLVIRERADQVPSTESGTLSPCPLAQAFPGSRGAR